jgi:proteasome accessory factor A
MVGHQTTHSRPLLNLRDEPHAGKELARMHIIFFDNVLAPVANYLKAGTTQLVLAMTEAGWADPGLLLDDPLAAAREVSRDLSLKQTLPMARRGLAWTAVEVQKAVADLAGEFVASGAAADVVPGAEAIVGCWRETLDLLARRDLGALARRCDWVLKYLLLDRQRGRTGLSWRSAEMKCLDWLYASIDPRDGLFWQMAAAGMVEAMPQPARVQRFVDEPPEDTRAYLRAHVMRRFGDHIIDMDWGKVRFRLNGERYWWTEARLLMPAPDRLGRAEVEPALERCATLQELIEAVGAEVDETSSGGGWGWWGRGEPRSGEAWGQRQGWSRDDSRRHGYSSSW